MPHTGPADAQAVAEKLRCALAAVCIEGVGTVTASFGVASYQPPETLDPWIARADAAMYQAKQAGRNAVRLAQPVAN
jgi:diguanylate cyclase (GGDEF)-like protein